METIDKIPVQAPVFSFWIRSDILLVSFFDKGDEMQSIDIYRKDEPSRIIDIFLNTFLEDIAKVAQSRNQQINASQLLTLLELFRGNINKLGRKCFVQQIQFHCMRISMEITEEGYIKFTLNPVDEKGKSVLPEAENTQFYLFVTESERQELEKRKGNRIMLSIDPENKNNPN